jgi:hypothetical protein
MVKNSSLLLFIDRKSQSVTDLSRFLKDSAAERRVLSVPVPGTQV